MMAVTIRFLVLCFSIILGFISPSLAGDETPTLAEDGHLSLSTGTTSPFWSLPMILTRHLRHGKVLMVKI
jgi:hypothetical protein